MPLARKQWTIPAGLTDDGLWELAEQERVLAEECRSGPQPNPKAAREHWHRHKAALGALEERGIPPGFFHSSTEDTALDSSETGSDELPGKERTSRKRLMYVELKTGFNDNGPAWIGYVQASKSGRTLYYHGRRLQRSARSGAGANHYDLDTGDSYWVSGIKKNGEDRHWAGSGPVEVDADAREEYERLRSNAPAGPKRLVRHQA